MKLKTDSALPKLIMTLGMILGMVFLGGAQTLDIKMTWPSDIGLESGEDTSFLGLEGALVLPHRRGENEEVLRSSFSGTSRDGSAQVEASLLGGQVRWQIRASVPGRYSFYVSDPEVLGGSAAPRKFAGSGLAVELKTPQGSFTFTPPDRPAGLWHVFDYYGGDGSIRKIDAVYPFSGFVYGFVSDSSTGEPIKDAVVELKSVVEGESRAVQTDGGGRYLFPAGFGGWNLNVKKPGFIVFKEEVFIPLAEYPVRVDAHLSSIMRESQYRFVVSWGRTPADLDAHVSGPTPGGGEFHISYRNMKTWGRRHFLDRDDTDGYGPETITLEKLDPGMYRFWIHNYSDKDSPSSTALSWSGAIARLYRESSLLAEVRVPEGFAGTTWNVFEMNGSTGELTSTDTVTK